MIRKLLDKLGEQTALAIRLRKIVENDFKQQQRTIKESLSLPSGARLLDVGCGTGEFAPFFPTEAYTGIDIDPANIAYARAHYPHHFEVGDALALSYPDASFDAVLVAGVLHHLPDEAADKALTEIRRVLKPGGTFLIMEDTKHPRLITRLMHWLDQGAYIRTNSAWDAMFRKHFTIERTWTFKSGVCFYSAFVLTYGK